MGYFVDGDNIDPINNPSQLSDPQGLAFDSEGNLYISESRGHTIRMIKRWYP
jgi:secreted PhoX family phosphatase